MEHHSNVMGDLSTSDAAKYLGVHPGTMANWRAWNIGPKFVRKGRKIYYKLQTLKDFKGVS